jgi:radical SAM protein with 4Fe4S-binding SPASM domain
LTDQYAIDGTKVGLHPQRLAQWLDAGDDIDELLKVYPLYVEVSPVGQCNHRCTFCSVDYIGYVRRQLELGPLTDAISDMAAHGIKSIMYAGEGEPLLHRQIGTITNFTKAAGIDVAFTTNATGLTTALTRECLGSITWLKASVNGGTEKVYADVHQTKPADFFRVIDNLANAVYTRKHFGWTTTLGAQMVVLPENIDTAVELAETCSDIGLDYLVLKPYSQNPHSTDTASKGYDRFDFRDRDLANLAKVFSTATFKVVYRANTVESLYEQERAYKTCHATPFMWAYIMATGDVYACSAHLLDDKFNLGNINEKSFTEIWQGEKRKKLIEEMRTFDVSVCRKNCRMEFVNRQMNRLKYPAPHDNFI